MRDITPRDIIMDTVAGILIEVTDIRIAGATTTDGVIGIATLEAAGAHQRVVLSVKC